MSIGTIALLAVVCVAVIGFGGITAFQRSQQEASMALETVKEFVKAGSQNDAAAGFALFDPIATNQTVTQERVAQLFAEERDVFQGSPELAQDSFTIYRGTNGTTATLQGTLTYLEQPAKRFMAQLRQTDGRWRLTSIQFADSLGN